MHCLSTLPSIFLLLIRALNSTHREKHGVNHKGQATFSAMSALVLGRDGTEVSLRCYVCHDYYHAQSKNYGIEYGS